MSSPETVRRRTVDPLVAHHRARVGSLRKHGHDDEANEDSRDLHARKLLLAARRTVAASPLPLTPHQVDEIVATLRAE